MSRVFNNILLIFILFILVGCSHKTKPELVSGINIEMFGSWRNDNGCDATFAKVKNNLVLIKFTDEKSNQLSNIILMSKKISIMTTFKAQDSKLDFSGSFLEGMVIINSYCSQPLHKIDNY